jgi:hypothetical protein
MKLDRMLVWLPAAGIMTAVLAAGPARAAVIDSSEVGFTVNQQVIVAARPEKAYRQVVNAVGRWWSPIHTYSGDAANMYMEDRAGGCFCERLQGGGSVQHMRVLYAEPGKTLRLSGGLGPLQTLAVTGSMAWEFVPVDKNTRIELTYAVGGYFPGGPGDVAAAVDRVMGEQLERLKRFLETGRSDPPR